MRKICIDAGHYGKYNRSPIVPAYYESVMNWKLHLKLKEYLVQHGFEVITTRESLENDLSLYNRGATAKGCDLFLSLHSNAAYSTKEFEAGGNAHKNEYVDRVDIYAPLDGRAHDLAQKLADTIAEVMGTDQGGFVKTRASGSGGEYYGVIRGAAAVDVPGLLVEHSFHTNARSAKWLLDETNLDELARAEAAVIAEYYRVSSETAGYTLIEGKARATDYQMEEYIKRIRPDVAQSVLDMIPLYISEGTAEGIRGDIAFAQSCLETGNFGFDGSAVTLDQNNFCGLGVKERGMKGHSFETPQKGIRAQIQHLKAYANNKALANAKIDPRFDKVQRGCAPYVEWLGATENPDGRGWASGAGYGEKILGILDKICAIGVKRKVMRHGDSGDDVKKLQSRLNMLGHDCGEVDGVFGNKTKAAVIAFQKAAGIGVDGIAGPITLDALEAITKNPYAEPTNNVKKGFKGDAVRWVQWELKRIDANSLPKFGIDGDFGNETLKAVKAFQRAHNLDTDGIVGKKTRAALKNA